MPKARLIVLVYPRDRVRLAPAGSCEALCKQAAAQVPINNRMHEITGTASKPLVTPDFFPMFRLAQIARACGRVSVGGDPDKRPEKRRK
jgi:hypothetical protein